MHQAVIMAAFKTSEVYELLLNILKAKRYVYFKDRQKAMKTQSQREMCLYYTGKEDGINELLEAIDKTIADGEEIRDTNELLASVTGGQNEQ